MRHCVGLPMPCLSFPTSALESGFSHVTAQNPPMGMSGHPPRPSRKGGGKENPSGNGTILPPNPTACFPQSGVGAIPVLVLSWSIFTPWSSPAPCSRILPLAVMLWKRWDLLFIPGVSLPPCARPHACPGHFKSPLSTRQPACRGIRRDNQQR